MLRVGAGLSTEGDARQAALEATLSARAGAPPMRPALALAFASPHHAERAAAVVDAVHEAASPERLIGCVGEAVLAGAREVEGRPAVSVWLAWLPEPAPTYHVQFAGEVGGWEGWPEGEPGETHLLICDPFTFPADAFLRSLESARPETRVVGGMASGGAGPGDTVLFLDDRVLRSGAVGARLPRGVRVETVVSQGCRPVGPAYTVTRSDGNVILELAGRPPLELLRELYASLEARDRALVGRGLHVGLVMDEYKPEHERGDFLIRGVLGGDRETGAIAVGDRVPVGATIRFHVRDADSADEDLRSLLSGVEERPAGALLFTCNGRGSRLFATPDHDAGLVSERLGAAPLAGFFCAGELGPVGGRSFLHGYTASLALFYE